MQVWGPVCICGDNQFHEKAGAVQFCGGVVHTYHVGGVSLPGHDRLLVARPRRAGNHHLRNRHGRLVAHRCGRHPLSGVFPGGSSLVDHVKNMQYAKSCCLKVLGIQQA